MSSQKILLKIVLVLMVTLVVADATDTDVIKEIAKRYGTTCDHFCNCNDDKNVTIQEFENEICFVRNVTGYSGGDTEQCFKMSEEFDFSSTYSALYFKVRGPSDAHVYLDNEFNTVYEIVIGAHSNNRTDVRKGPKHPRHQVETERTRGILRKNQFQSFFIEHNVTSGWIRTFLVDKTMLVTSWRDKEHKSFSYFSFGAWVDVTLEFAYNCTPKSNASEMFKLQSLAQGAALFKPGK